MLSEFDLNLLEAYLDDALSATEVQRLDSRLSENDQLSQAFDSLKADRAARIAVFNSTAPTTAETEHFADSVISSIQRRQRTRWIAPYARVIGGIAACLIIGFAVGWMGRGRPVQQVSELHASPAVPAVTPAKAHPDSHLIIHAAKAPEPGQYQVAVLDADGNVVALQRFTRLEDARQFADDLGQFEVRRQQVQQSQAMLVSDSF